MRKTIAENYENLAAAIVQQAISDYRQALRDFKKQKQKLGRRHAIADINWMNAYRQALRTLSKADIREAIDAAKKEQAARREYDVFETTYDIDDCERFFKGDWCKALTTYDGIWIMEQVRKQEMKEVNYGS